MPFKDPERRRAYQADYRRQQRAGERGKSGRAVVPAPFRLQTAREVLALIEEQVNAVRADLGLRTVERARCVGFLASIALRAVETGDLEARLEALEAVLKARAQR